MPMYLKLLVLVTSVPGKIMENIILGDIEKHLEDSTVSHNQHDLMREKSCLLNLISFYDNEVPQVNLGKPGDKIFWDFSKGLDIVSHRILLDKMSSSQLENQVRWWGSSRLTGQAQRVMVTSD